MEDADLFYGHLVYITAIWYILGLFGLYIMAIWYMLWPFGIFYGYLENFFTFWYVVPIKIWQHGHKGFLFFSTEIFSVSRRILGNSLSTQSSGSPWTTFFSGILSDDDGDSTDSD
jgi:hypothetical protein